MQLYIGSYVDCSRVLPRDDISLAPLALRSAPASAAECNPVGSSSVAPLCEFRFNVHPLLICAHRKQTCKYRCRSTTRLQAPPQYSKPTHSAAPNHLSARAGTTSGSYIRWYVTGRLLSFGNAPMINHAIMQLCVHSQVIASACVEYVRCTSVRTLLHQCSGEHVAPDLADAQLPRVRNVKSNPIVQHGLACCIWCSI